MTSGIATAVPRETDFVTASAAVKALETPPERGAKRGMLYDGGELGLLVVAVSVLVGATLE